MRNIARLIIIAIIIMIFYHYGISKTLSEAILSILSLFGVGVAITIACYIMFGDDW